MFLNFDSGSAAAAAAPPSRAPVVLGVSISLYIVTIVFVSAQIVVKGKLGKLGIEDILISIAATLLLGLLICTVISCKYGFGMHVVDIKDQWILPYGKVAYANIALATVCFAITKAAMLCFYLRFATSPRFRIAVWLSIAYTGLSTTATLLVNLFGCAPLSGAWDRRPGHPSVCITTEEFYFYSTASNIVTDIMLLVLPVPILLALSLGWKVKLGLVAMFSMGFLVTAVSGVSLWKMVIAVAGGDIIWDGAYSWMWTLAELNVGIMTTCMPGMRMFVAWARGDRKVVVEGALQDTIGGGARYGRKKMTVRESEGLSVATTEEGEKSVDASTVQV